MSAPSSAVDALRAAGMDNPRLEARLLWQRAQGVAATFEGLLARRVAHEPLAYILGRKEFWSLDFTVGPGVLIPRPDTETLIEAVLKHYPVRSSALTILDLGCGSGCILASLLSEYPHATGLGVESSDVARGFAIDNLNRLGLGARARLLAGDWRDATGHFDVVVSNPPYIETAAIAGLQPDVRLFEPFAALDGGVDGLDAYRVLAPLAHGLVNPGGMVFFEIGQGQDGAVAALLTDAGLVSVAYFADLSGTIRVVGGQRPQLAT